jgi:RNA polymerase sigma factor (sigma-70 family)
MKEGKPYLPWPEADDRIVVEEMLSDPLSGQWYECREFVRRLVQVQAKNIPKDSWEDIAHDAMMKIHRSLPSFQHHCTFRTWLYGIVRNCIIDAYRKIMRAGQFTTPLGDPHDDSESEGDIFPANAMKTAEDEYIIHDELREALAALQEYVSTHSHPIRNGQILNIVLLEGLSLEEAARAIGCSAPVAGYVVREAQRYVRIKLGYQRKLS